MFTQVRQRIGRVWQFPTAIMLFQFLMVGTLLASTGQMIDNKMFITVRGTVTEGETGEPLPGVNVLVKGTGTGTVTDINGVYSIDVANDDDILVFSFIGYKAEEVVVGSRTTIDVQLSPDLQAMQEVVV